MQVFARVAAGVLLCIEFDVVLGVFIPAVWWLACSLFSYSDRVECRGVRAVEVCLCGVLEMSSFVTLVC